MHLEAAISARLALRKINANGPKDMWRLLIQGYVIGAKNPQRFVILQIGNGLIRKCSLKKGNIRWPINTKAYGKGRKRWVIL